eukprot:jgi/Mesen1/7692/ME000405S06978
MAAAAEAARSMHGLGTAGQMPVREQWSACSSRLLRNAGCPSFRGEQQAADTHSWGEELLVEGGARSSCAGALKLRVRAPAGSGTTRARLLVADRGRQRGGPDVWKVTISLRGPASWNLPRWLQPSRQARGMTYAGPPFFSPSKWRTAGSRAEEQ